MGNSMDHPLATDVVTTTEEGATVLLEKVGDNVGVLVVG